MKNILKYTLFLLLPTFTACSNEGDFVHAIPTVQSQPSEALELTVSASNFVMDGAPDTRAIDNGNETTFESGDRVGIIILDESNVPIYNNIPYKYEKRNNQWFFDSSNGEGKDICYYDSKARTYIVYYPYNETANGCKNENDLKNTFKPQPNQSTKFGYRTSDLMVWSITSSTPKKSLDVTLKHAYASVSLSPIARWLLDDGDGTECFSPSLKISDVNFTVNNTVYVPYPTADGNLRCILPLGFAGDIRCFYTIDGKAYGNTISIPNEVVANTCYTSAPERNSIYSFSDAKVGDFYCKRSNNMSYLIPRDATLTLEQQGACIGIVLKVGKDDSGSWQDNCQYKFKDTNIEMSDIHGYVLALYDANDGNECQWGSEGTRVGTNTEDLGFYGYMNTQTIISFNQGRNGTLLSAFPATYYATDGYEDKCSAPDNSSGWFLPSVGQCIYWRNNKTELLTQVKKATGNNTYSWMEEYWSSSEDDFLPADGAQYRYFQWDGSVYGICKSCNHGVRAWLAF